MLSRLAATNEHEARVVWGFGRSCIAMVFDTQEWKSGASFSVFGPELATATANSRGRACPAPLSCRSYAPGSSAMVSPYLDLVWFGCAIK